MHQILSKQKIFHYFMHMRAKNNMWILDLLIVSVGSRIHNIVPYGFIVPVTQNTLQNCHLQFLIFMHCAHWYSVRMQAMHDTLLDID